MYQSDESLKLWREMATKTREMVTKMKEMVTKMKEIENRLDDYIAYRRKKKEIPQKKKNRIKKFDDYLSDEFRAFLKKERGATEQHGAEKVVNFSK